MTKPKNTERFILINRPSDLSCMENDEYDGIYAGNEYCQKLIPSRKDIRQFINFTSKEDLKLVLVSGPLGDDGMKKMKDIIDVVSAQGMLHEIVVNDWGLINHVLRNYNNCQIIIGRSLASFTFPYKKGFLYRNKIRWFETDSFNDRLFNIREYLKIKISLYYPYFVCNNTRYCPVANLHRHNLSNQGIPDCQKECLTMDNIYIANPLLSQRIILKGCIQCSHQEPTKHLFKKLNPDRIIFQPHAPL